LRAYKIAEIGALILHVFYYSQITVQTNKFSDVSASFRAIFSVSQFKKFKKFLLGSTRPDSTKASPHCQLRSWTSYHCPMILTVV